jgi:hypothetical protein
MSRAIVIALAVTVAALGSAQPPVAPAPRPAVGEVSLLFTQWTPNKDGVETTHRLLRVRFRSGVMQEPEVVWEGERAFLSELSYHRLIDNRFLMTASGGVLDVVAKKVIHPEQGADWCHVQGTRVVYRVEQDGRDQGIFAFDLVTRNVENLSKLGDPDYDWFGYWHQRISPDGRRIVVGKEVSTVYEAGKKPRSLGKGFTVTGGWFGAPLIDPPRPILWLDNDRILTQVRNGELVTVKLDGTRTPVVKVPSTETPDEGMPTLHRDGGGRVIYFCSRATYVIDVDAKTWQREEWVDLGHGFTASLSQNNDAAPELRYRGDAIRRAWSAGLTTEGYLAIVDDDGEVRVWSASTREWSVLKMTSDVMIGWMK